MGFQPFSGLPNVYGSLAAPLNPHRPYQVGETLYYTSSDTFTKADYRGLRAVRVKVQGGGAGGGGVASAEGRYAGGGGGGGYSEKFIPAEDLSASESVTVGGGGNGAAAGNNHGDNGGDSSFGTHLTGSGGTSGRAGTTTGTDRHGADGGPGGGASGGDLNIPGERGGARHQSAITSLTAPGGNSFMGFGSYQRLVNNDAGGSTGRGYGAGGGGAASSASGGSGAGGGDGADGIVIVELLY